MEVSEAKIEDLQVNVRGRQLAVQALAWPG